MEKRFSTFITTLVVTYAACMAVPACPTPATVTQPDGTSLTISLHGDEFMSITTTIDGYTVIRDADGTYRYAVREGDQLMAGKLIAHNPDARTVAEIEFLEAAGKALRPAATATQMRMKSLQKSGSLSLRSNAPHYDYKKFRGLVILVEFKDCKFLASDPQSLFGDMISQPDYEGYTPEHGFFFQEYTGSVRDYFYDNSSGQFDPTFDIVGPVSVSRSQYDINRTEKPCEIIREALNNLDSQIDYSIYDTDNDGTVDMFYVIFAGGGSNFAGNDPRLVWPHASMMESTRLDNVNFGRYACSTELYGAPSSKQYDGIGTICHEFSHVLGLMDEYDTDYEGSGGLADHPGTWSVMASGSYLNQARTPTGYTLMQRYQSGFCVPQEINEAGVYTLEDIDESNTGYRISTSDPREYFLLENKRQSGKWNAYTQGSGMLVHRVDSTNTNAWTYNVINTNPDHCYYLLLRAVRKQGGDGALDHSGDPFPGTGNITEINFDTNPSLLAWSGKFSEYTLSDISENADGTISFKATEVKFDILQEDFEDMATSGKFDTNVPGKFCDWSFYFASVVDNVDSKAAGIYKNGYFETSEIPGHTNTLSITVSNLTSKPAAFNIRYSLGGGNWDYLTEPGGQQALTIGAEETNHVFRFEIPNAYRDNLKLQVRLANGSGDSKSAILFDDITCEQSGSPLSEIVHIMTDSPSPEKVCIGSDCRLAIKGITGLVDIYDICGRKVATASANDMVEVPSPGTYILQKK